MAVAPTQDLAALHSQIQAIAQRIERLDSIEAIRALRARYHELVNEDAGDRLYELFAPDAVVAYGGRAEVRGQDRIRAFFASFPIQAARQFIHSHVVQVQGDRGTGSSYLDGRPVRDGKSFYVVGRFRRPWVPWRFRPRCLRRAATRSAPLPWSFPSQQGAWWTCRRAWLRRR